MQFGSSHQTAAWSVIHVHTVWKRVYKIEEFGNAHANVHWFPQSGLQPWLLSTLQIYLNWLKHHVIYWNYLKYMNKMDQDFSNFVSMELSLWHLDPLRANAFVPLPKWIRDKRAVTNVVGTGDDCFKWAVLAGLHPATDHPERMENYLPYVNLYDFSNLNYPVPLSSITPFAAKNGISINVYAVEDGKRFVFPLCVTDLLMHESHEIQQYSTCVEKTHEEMQSRSTC